MAGNTVSLAASSVRVLDPAVKLWSDRDKTFRHTAGDKAELARNWLKDVLVLDFGLARLSARTK